MNDQSFFFVGFFIGAFVMFLWWMSNIEDISKPVYVVTEVRQESVSDNMEGTKKQIVEVNNEWMYYLSPEADIRVGDTLYFVPIRH